MCGDGGWGGFIKANKIIQRFFSTKCHAFLYVSYGRGRARLHNKFFFFCFTWVGLHEPHFLITSALDGKTQRKAKSYNVDLRILINSNVDRLDEKIHKTYSLTSEYITMITTHAETFKMMFILHKCNMSKHCIFIRRISWWTYHDRLNI